MDIENGQFTIKNGVLIHVNDKKAGRIVIPDGVKSIGDKAFMLSRIREIRFPDTLTDIGKQAFWGCNCLKEIIIPDSVKKIGNHAFEQCDRLEKLVLGDNVEKIGCGAFLSCRRITGRIHGRNVRSIGDSAFHNCRYISELSFPECTETGDFTFYGCFGLESITLGEISRIGNRTFCMCFNLESFTVPASVVQICRQAFWSCTSLTVRVPANLSEKTGEDAFYDCREVIYI